MSMCLIVFIVQLNKELTKKKVGCPGGAGLGMLSQMWVPESGSSGPLGSPGLQKSVRQLSPS